MDADWTPAGEDPRMMSRTKRTLIATVVALSVGAGAAFAATGDLTGQGCIGDPDAAAGCSGSQDGMGGAQSVAVSPDGKSVYVASREDRAIARYNRDPATGALTPKGCFADVDPGSAACGVGNAVQGLGAPRGVAVSPDGKSVYVVSSNDEDAIVHFSRTTDGPDTGALTFQGCIADIGTPAPTCGPEAQGLNDARGVAVSPDNQSVYVVSGSDTLGDDAITRFARDTLSGALSGAVCIEDPPLDHGCAGTQDGLGNAFGVAVSADNASVYVASTVDSAVVRFNRSTVDGTITPQGCIEDPPVDAGCVATQQGLGGAYAIATSPDGNSVYAVAPGDSAIARFGRGAAGVLTPQGCIAALGDAAGCGATQDGLDAARGVAVSPDSRSVYTAAFNAGAVTDFDRDPTTGALTGKGCVSDLGFLNCGAHAQGLSQAHAVAVSPDNASVYAVSFLDSAIVHFFRETTGSTAPPTAPPTEPDPVDPDPNPSDPTDGRLFFDPGLVRGFTLVCLIPSPGSVGVTERRAPGRSALAKRKKLLKPSSATGDAAGELRVKLRLTKTAKKIYRKKGKLKIKVVVTFTPAIGDPQIQNATLKAKKGK